MWAIPIFLFPNFGNNESFKVSENHPSIILISDFDKIFECISPPVVNWPVLHGEYLSSVSSGNPKNESNPKNSPVIFFDLYKS